MSHLLTILQRTCYCCWCPWRSCVIFKSFLRPITTRDIFLSRGDCKRPSFDQLHAHILEHQQKASVLRYVHLDFSWSKHGRSQSPLASCEIHMMVISHDMISRSHPFTHLYSAPVIKIFLKVGTISSDKVANLSKVSSILYNGKSWKINEFVTYTIYKVEWKVAI